MKILVISNMYPSKKAPSYGVFVKNMVGQLETLGHVTKLCVMHKQTNRIIKTIKYCMFYAKTILTCVFGKFDIIYVHYPSYSSMPVLFVSRFKKLNIYTNVHGSDVLPITDKQKQQEKYTYKCIEKSEKIIVPSAYFNQIVWEKYKTPQGKTYIYPSGGVDKKLFYKYSHDKKKSVKKRLGIPEDRYVLGFVSRIYEAKGWKTFLEGAKYLNEKRNDIVYLIVGSGEDDNALDQSIMDMGLSSSTIRFPGQPQEDLTDYYNVIDLFVFPTAAAESLGLVAIEAMACGCPVIASDYAAPKYYIEDDYNGYKFKMGNGEELANKVNVFFNKSQEEREIMSDNALEYSRKFERQSILRDLRTIFDD